MAKKNVELASGRKVQLKEMSVDEIDFCSDIAEVIYNQEGEVTTVRGTSKSRTAWIRRGLDGGDFKDFSLDNKGFASDSVIRELTEVEKNELMMLIQGYQSLGE
tara:strand:+ start:1741 stop:2052 length:312 start_codon:yes stop_codon:yes gene_type:complete